MLRKRHSAKFRKHIELTQHFVEMRDVLSTEESDDIADVLCEQWLKLGQFEHDLINLRFGFGKYAAPQS